MFVADLFPSPFETCSPVWPNAVTDPSAPALRAAAAAPNADRRLMRCWGLVLFMDSSMLAEIMLAEIRKLIGEILTVGCGIRGCGFILFRRLCAKSYKSWSGRVPAERKL